MIKQWLVNNKDGATNAVALVLVIVGSFQTYFQSVNGNIDWAQLVLTIGGAVVAYLTGKKPPVS